MARALLVMITQNIGQVAYLNAQLHGIKKIFFVEEFQFYQVLLTGCRTSSSFSGCLSIFMIIMICSQTCFKAYKMVRIFVSPHLQW